MGFRMGHVLPGPVVQQGDAVALDSRALIGLIAGAEAWDGDLIVIAPQGPTDGVVPVDSTLIERRELPFEVVTIPLRHDAVSDLDLDVLTALHSPKMDALRGVAVPTVLTSEQTLSIRLGINAAHLAGVDRLRGAVGLMRMEWRLRQMMARASSAQFNGPAALDAYGSLVEDPLAYHDHRIMSSDVESARQVDPWRGDQPLRLGFSGRLHPIKGPQFAVRLARLASAHGLPVELHVFGAGPLEQSLRASAGENVQFRGFQQFRSEWLPTVRDEIDLMVMPHVQGDPSCTYFEALGSGAPVLGFENETLTPLVRDHAVGWAVRQGDVDGLLNELTAIIQDPPRLAGARQRGLDLVTANSFELTTQRRMDHIRRTVERVQ